MHQKILIGCLLFLSILTVAADKTIPQLKPEQILSSIEKRLTSEFDAMLENYNEYEKKVNKECRYFPEGDLFPYVYPALGYLNLCFKNLKYAPQAKQKIQKLINSTIKSVTKKVRPRDGNLNKLFSYKKSATYLGQLNLLLSVYSLVYRDNKYHNLNKHLSLILNKALLNVSGKPLHSYPDYTWPFDTIPVIASLLLYDEAQGTDTYKNIATKHFKWLKTNGSHPLYKLPFSRINPSSYEGKEVPRGCDLSLQLCILPQINKKYAKQLYQQYLKYFWIKRGAISGFAEWPNGKSKFQDIDSGPIFMGIGMGATGTGVGAVIAMDDKERMAILASELLTIDLLRPIFLKIAQNDPTLGKAYPISEKYFTGFLMGDLMLFYCVTWRPWKKLER